MDRIEQIQNEVEKTLRALDDMPALEPNPYLLTRIRARLAAESARGDRQWSGRAVLRPVALALIVLLNIVTALHVAVGDRDSAQDQLIYSLSREYAPTQDYYLMDE